MTVAADSSCGTTAYDGNMAEGCGAENHLFV